MKFQNSSFKFFFERTDEQTDGRTSRKQYAPHFFKVGGINNHFMVIFLYNLYIFGNSMNCVIPKIML